MRANLKDERDVVFLIESSRFFHNIGAEKEKAHSPYVTEFTVGTSVKSSLEDELDFVVDGISVVGGTARRPDKVHG